jgi:hypothetical protein
MRRRRVGSASGVQHHETPPRAAGADRDDHRKRRLPAPAHHAARPSCAVATRNPFAAQCSASSSRRNASSRTASRLPGVGRREIDGRQRWSVPPFRLIRDRGSYDLGPERLLRMAALTERLSTSFETAIMTTPPSAPHVQPSLSRGRPGPRSCSLKAQGGVAVAESPDVAERARALEGFAPRALSSISRCRRRRHAAPH